MIRVFLADDQLLVREGIRALLEMDPEIAIVGEAEDGVETVDRVKAAEIDVLLLDIRMPRKNGLEVLQDLAASGALPATLVLTTFDDTTIVLEAIRAGARGFMLKDVSYKQLIDAIRAIAAGETVFQPAVTQRLLRVADALPRPTHALVESLTERELQVVRLMAGGCSNKEIAHALGTAEGTVKNHVSSILGKLDARDRTRAVLRALEERLL
ncbi:MAG TPA: response regulator transcription factor [Thermoanaerobaculia bacterium]|nr:response regulator transcription factor [Thermoanaerobaculia bacterium]